MAKPMRDQSLAGFEEKASEAAAMLKALATRSA